MFLAAAGPDAQPTTASAELPDAAERVQDYASRSKSASTIRAYASGWRDFLAFCANRDLSTLPASDQTVAQYLSSMADRGAKAATIARRLVVISQAHKGADLPSPTTSIVVHRLSNAADKGRNHHFYQCGSQRSGPRIRLTR